MRLSYILAAALSLLAAPAAFAAVSLSTVAGNAVYSGPAPVYTFETPTPVTGGLVTSAVVTDTRARPLGSTGNFWAVGPTDGSPGFLNLSSFAAIGSLTFIWGSVDAYNGLDVLDRVGNVIASFTGLNASATHDGNTTNPLNNPLATLTFTGATQTNIGGLRLSSTQNAFEIDNISGTRPDGINLTASGVPEPATWLTMIMGFAGIGFAMRRKSRDVARRVNYA